MKVFPAILEKNCPKAQLFYNPCFWEIFISSSHLTQKHTHHKTTLYDISNKYSMYLRSPSPSFQINYELPPLLRLLLLLLLTTFTSAIAIIFFNIFMVSYSACVSVVNITSIYRGQLPSSPVDSVFTSSVLHKMRGISLVIVVTSWASALSAVRSCHQLPLHNSRCFVY